MCGVIEPPTNSALFRDKRDEIDALLIGRREWYAERFGELGDDDVAVSGERVYTARGSEMKTSDVALAFPHDLVLIEVVSARLTREMQVEGDPLLLASALERMILKKQAPACARDPRRASGRS